MDMRTFQKARSIIVDEIIGCTFALEDKHGAASRAEEIIAALEKDGFLLSSSGEPPPMTTIQLVDGKGLVVEEKLLK